MKKWMIPILMWGVVTSSDSVHPWDVRRMAVQERSQIMNCDDTMKWQCQDMAGALNAAHERQDEAEPQLIDGRPIDPEPQRETHP